MTVKIAPSPTRGSLDETIVAELRGQLHGALLTPDESGYDEARRVRNGLIDRHPALIVRCSGTADVVACVNFAREHRLLLSVRGGGHNVAGNAVNDGGLVIDLSAMRGVWVDPRAQVAVVQG
ncbi:MAG TPA: FAD-dependent oxidoreductase, partial [Thermomicrobiales bacterium]|nr:FAD-dependent oxidoreductase [Thermomicrobiales bacterium]